MNLALLLSGCFGFCADKRKCGFSMVLVGEGVETGSWVCGFIGALFSGINLHVAYEEFIGKNAC